MRQIAVKTGAFDHICNDHNWRHARLPRRLNKRRIVEIGQASIRLDHIAENAQISDMRQRLLQNLAVHVRIDIAVNIYCA
ncbi:hypothetical protein SDC9_157600 [bioreactor metagenome]|uniref:Uncharacterized protein n=1 Tax=bioreactor metagenome TaxID=1076179 RepID=A0A645F7F6_9ZZZZ